MKKVSIAAGLALATISFVALLGAEPSTDEICAGGYSKAHRMPYSESRDIKRKLLWQRCSVGGNSPTGGCNMGDYELDHIVPLCLGGSNNSSNLQLQPWPEARKKDELEVMACKMVCAGRLNIDAARSLFTNWRTSYKEVFGVEP